MFRMEDLKNLSCEKFKLQLKEYWKSDAFPNCIREVYATSEETQAAGTRKVVVEEAALHRKDLVQKLLFRDLFRDLGDFALDLVLKSRCCRPNIHNLLASH
ncbi:hypothetical protein VE02_09947, partial [Pseudogymnoascus sp. 03VT05]